MALLAQLTLALDMFTPGLVRICITRGVDADDVLGEFE
jgi:hypothetical protein